MRQQMSDGKAAEQNPTKMDTVDSDFQNGNLRGAHARRGAHSRVEVSGCCTGPRGSSCPHVMGVGDSEPLHFVDVRYESSETTLAPDSKRIRGLRTKLKLLRIT